jgi:hypothetical protein
VTDAAHPRPLTGGAVIAAASRIGVTGVGFLIGCHFYRSVTGRRVLLSMVPTRPEFADLRRLAQAAVLWRGD